VEYPAQIWFDVQVAGASGAGAPTGTVQLFDAGNPIATLTLDPNGYAYGLEGESPDYYYNNCIEYQVELANIPVFNAGAHTITATYSGDNTFPATSTTVSPSPINVIANADKTSLTISPKSDILVGQAVQLTAAISGDTSTAVGAPGGHSSFNLASAANAAACPVTPIAPYGLCTTYTGTFTGATTAAWWGIRSRSRALTTGTITAPSRSRPIPGRRRSRSPTRRHRADWVGRYGRVLRGQR